MCQSVLAQTNGSLVRVKLFIHIPTNESSLGSLSADVGHRQCGNGGGGGWAFL